MRNKVFKPVALLLLSVATFVTSCKKEAKDNSDVTIVNRIDRPITVDLYVSADDYANNSNLQERIVIEPNENKILPGGTFAKSTTYHMDWYSEDYYYNNWYNDDYPVTGNRVRIQPEPGSNTYYLDPGLKGQGRKAFLKGGGTETTWISIGAFLYSGTFGYTNEWNTLTPNERYRTITIKKGFNAEYLHKDATGTLVTENLRFMVQQTEVPYIEFKNAAGQAAGNMTGGKLPTGSAPDYYSSSIDTVMALFPDNEYLFMMVRK
ncbi:MAG TPA: hypothetical protein VIN07_10165 [Flavipsychrobacter sp.]